MDFRPITELKPYADNPRRITEKAVKAVAESIKKFGFLQPIVVDADGVVLAGHTRLKAAEYLRLDKVPVITADQLTPEMAKAYRIADNKTGEISAWNFDLLPDEMAPIEDVFDFTKLGFDQTEIDKILGKAVYSTDKDPDAIPEDLPPVPITQPGDIYELGEHRLICGDATDPDVLTRLMGDDRADIVITDPPYGVDYDKSKIGKVENDDLKSDDLQAFITAAFTVGKQFCKPGAAFYVWFPSSRAREFSTAINNAGITLRQLIIWRKQQPTLSWDHYLYLHEPCFYCGVPGAAVFWNGDKNEKTFFVDDTPNPNKMNESELRKLLKKVLRELGKVSDVIEEKKPATSKLHPTQKPTRLYQRIIGNSSRRGEILLDLFGGSGTAIISAEETRRRARVVEIDPHFCDVIVKRWEDYTGSKAEKRQ